MLVNIEFRVEKQVARGLASKVSKSLDIFELLLSRGEQEEVN